MWDWQAVGITIILIQLAAARLVVSEWVPKLEVTQTLGLYAAILGLLMGYSSLNRKNVVWMTIEYGVLLVPALLLGTIESSQRSGIYYEDFRAMFIRIFESIWLFIKNQPVDDTLFFVLLTSIGFWIIGAYVGYRLTRHSEFLDAILGPGVVILVVQMYDPWVPWRIWALALYIFFSLVLSGRMYYLENKRGWKQKKIFFYSDAEWEFSQSILITAALAVMIAWSLPSIFSSIKPAANAWRELIQPVTDRMSNGLMALESPYGSPTTRDFYGSDLKLGNDTPTSKTPIFYVQVAATEADVLRYYWRGRIYDKYENGQWTSTNSSTQDFNSQNDEIRPLSIRKHTEVDFKFTMNFPHQELIYAPAATIWVNHNGKMTVDTADGNRQDMLAMLADPSLTDGDTYEVRAMIAGPTVQDLRGAGASYPDWVSTEYLRVPENIKPQLQQLAEQITAPFNNPYDKAQAITSYLRREIIYQTSITETVPTGTDPLLWVLFDYKKGFCMYSASAEVLLLRTLGIPARMAVGFSEGTYDLQRDRYTVSPLNAHAWPEVYFPGIGWIEFEPTGNQAPLDRPQDQIDNPSNTTEANPKNDLLNPQADANLPINDLSTGDNPSTDKNASTSSRYLYPALIAFFLAAGIYLTKTYSLANRLPVYLAGRYAKNGVQPPHWLLNWSQWAQFLPIEKSYQAVNTSLRWLGHQQPIYKTPNERADILKQALPAATKEIEALTEEYQNALFTARPVNLTIARRASLKLLYKTWQVRFFNRKS